MLTSLNAALRSFIFVVPSEESAAIRALSWLPKELLLC